MECVQCGDDAFNRILIEQTTEKEHGGLCEQCESSEFGLLLSEPLWQQETGCALCPNEADVALAEVDCLIEWDDGGCEAEYTLDPETLTLCHEHIATILDIDEPVAAPRIETRA